MVDFQSLIETVRERHRRHTLQWIADQCEVGLSTIQMIKDTPGRQPRYDLGEKLVKLERRTRPRRPRG